MDILHVWDGDYPWDIRVNKISQSLVASGHQVHIVCRNTKRQPRYDFYNGYHIHRMPSLPGFLGKLNNVIGFPAFFNPMWIYIIYKICRKHKCQLVLVRDLPLSLTAILIARLLNKPCILDMAECYPELLRCIWKFEKFSFINVFVRNPFVADLIEKLAFSKLDKIWVMIEESRDRLIEKGVPESKIDIVSNTPVLSRFVKGTEAAVDDGFLKLLYVGLLNPSRGLDTTLRAVHEYVKSNKKIRLTIIGSGKAEDDLKALSTQLNLDDYVEFLGWMDNEKIPDYISKSDVGIVPHHKCSHWDTTIPNKLFDYMASGKPVIVSNAIPISRIVTEEKIGVVYTDFDPIDMCNKLQSIAHRETQNVYGANGRAAIESKYQWSNEEMIMKESIASLS